MHRGRGAAIHGNARIPHDDTGGGDPAQPGTREQHGRRSARGARALVRRSAGPCIAHGRPDAAVEDLASVPGPGSCSSSRCRGQRCSRRRSGRRPARPPFRPGRAGAARDLGRRDHYDVRGAGGAELDRRRAGEVGASEGDGGAAGGDSAVGESPVTAAMGPHNPPSTLTASTLMYLSLALAVLRTTRTVCGRLLADRPRSKRACGPSTQPQDSRCRRARHRCRYRLCRYPPSLWRSVSRYPIEVERGRSTRSVGAGVVPPDAEPEETVAHVPEYLTRE